MRLNNIFSKAIRVVEIIAISTALVACGNKRTVGDSNNTEVAAESITDDNLAAAIDSENSKDASIDFASLQKENPDIYAWLSIPNTGIDTAIVQSGIADDYYTSHDLHGADSEGGAAYTEMFTMRDMCDFNTVIRGSDSIFGSLTQFLNPEFFEKNEKFYIYLDGNVLTYEIVACYTTEGNSPVREYEFYSVDGCRMYINDVFNTRDMTKQLRADWEGLNEYNFLTSIYVDTPSENGKHLVLLGALTGDAAGTINRVVVDDPDDIDISALLSLMENAE